MRKAGERVATTTSSTYVETIPDPASSARGVPACSWPGQWLTVTEFSRVMGRRPQTVHWWIRTGVLAEFGIPICQFRHGGLHSGRVFIQNIY